MQPLKLVLEGGSSFSDFTRHKSNFMEKQDLVDNQMSNMRQPLGKITSIRQRDLKNFRTEYRRVLEFLKLNWSYSDRRKRLKCALCFQSSCAYRRLLMTNWKHNGHCFFREQKPRIHRQCSIRVNLVWEIQGVENNNEKTIYKNSECVRGCAIK